MRWKEIGQHAAVGAGAFALTPLAVLILGALVHLLMYLLCGIAVALLVSAAAVVGIIAMKAASKWFARRRMTFC